MSGVSIEVHPVLRRFRFVHALQEQFRAGAVSWVEGDVGAGGADVGVAERRGPELGQVVRVGTVEYETEVWRRVVVGDGRVVRRRSSVC